MHQQQDQQQLPGGTTTHSTSLVDLPIACITHILHSVPVHHRLSSCALVNTTWTAAAHAATTSISEQNVQNADKLMHSLSSLSILEHVTSLQLAAADAAGRILLPAPQHQLPQLLTLQLTGLNLFLTADQRHLGWLEHVTPRLTQLCLCNCTVRPNLDSLTALVNLKDTLQHLQLDVYKPLTATSVRSQSKLPTGVWQPLTKLTHLSLATQSYMVDSMLQELAGLTALQQLWLRAARLTAPALSSLETLQHLCVLQLWDAKAMQVSCSSTPVLTRLPSLQQLGVSRWQELDPGLLLSIRNLQHLELDAGRRPSNAEDAAAFVSALSQLTNLTQLQLAGLLWYVGPNLQAMQQLAAACGGLTASSKLVCLQVLRSTLPMGAWQHMLPATRRMPALQQLDVSQTSPAIGDDDSSLTHIVRCCPALTRLQLTGALRPGDPITPLLQLTGLKELELGAVRADTAAGTSVVLAQLTTLQRLVHAGATYLYPEALKLTALRQLTRLVIQYTAAETDQPVTCSLQNEVG